MKKRKTESKKAKKLYSFDLENDRKLRVYVNLTAAFTGVVMLFIGCKIVPFKELYNVAGLSKFTLRTLTLIMCMAACLALHELINIVAVRLMTGQSAETGFDRIYPYVGSRQEVDRTKYVIISLAPVIILGAALVALLFVVPKAQFWIVYITLMMHVTGSIGSIYCALRIITEKNGIKIKDNGRAVEIWLK